MTIDPNLLEALTSAGGLVGWLVLLWLVLGLPRITRHGHRRRAYQ